jgi:hypothetical protein
MKTNSQLSLKLLNDFTQSSKNRSTFFLIYNVLPKILEWHIHTWRNEIKLLDNPSKLNTWADYFQMGNLLDSVFSLTEERMLTDNAPVDYGFFKCLEGHLNKYRDEVIRVKEVDHHYVQDILSTFYRTFLNKISQSPKGRDVWDHYFPKKWKVSQSNVLDVNPILSRVSFDQFIRWAQDRIRQSHEIKTDYDLNEVSENLFPEVDPVTWAQVLIFTLLPYDPAARIKSVIQTPWIFGFSTRIRMYQGDHEEDKESLFKRVEQETSRAIKSDEDRTYSFVIALRTFVPLFYHTFTESNLENFINQAKQIDISEDAEQERKRKKLLELFQGLQRALKNENSIA